MLIAIEAERANTDRPTGVEHYAKQLILALADIDRQNQYILYLRTQPQAWIKSLPENFSFKVMPFPLAWTQIRLSWEILRHRPDALFIPASALPLIHPRNSVVTVHDLAWAKFPETFNTWRLLTLKLFTWFAARNAAKVIAISEQTKKDLISRYNLPAKKISVVYHGFSPEHEQIQSNADELRKLAALPKKFILYLGTIQPRKNPQGLIAAFTGLKQAGKLGDYGLVLAGGKGWLYDSILQKIEAVKNYGVIYFGYVQDRLALLKKAEALVNPSFYEGFGLQALDAFAASVPLASSSAPPMPEICGNAAEYFDPNDQTQMQQAILNIVENPARRDDLVAKGRVRLGEFTWKKCAVQTLAAITNFERRHV